MQILSEKVKINFNHYPYIFIVETFQLHGSFFFSQETRKIGEKGASPN